MRIAAFSTLTGARSVKNATGVEPLAFPPHEMKTFKREWLEGFDLLYFHLHGLPNQSYWYGDDYLNALSTAQVKEARLNNCIVFAANCFGLDSKMQHAFLDAGASAFVAGPGKNYTVKFGIVRGADLLGAHLIRYLSVGMDIDAALDNAKNRIRARALVPILGKPERDALEFQITTR